MSQQDHDIYKQRLSATGAPIKDAVKHDVKTTTKDPLHSKNVSCMTCYGSEETPGQCCNTCDEVGYSSGQAQSTLVLFQCGMVMLSFRQAFLIVTLCMMMM